jgi:hypothetical protein
MAEKDLAEFSELRVVQIQQKQCVYYEGPFDLVKFHITQMFGELDEDGEERLKVNTFEHHGR